MFLGVAPAGRRASTTSGARLPGAGDASRRRLADDRRRRPRRAAHAGARAAAAAAARARRRATTSIARRWRRSWNFIRNPNAGRRFADGAPRLPALDRLGDRRWTTWRRPPLIVRRQRHFRVRCRAALDFAPREADEEAGLTVRASDAFHYDLGRAAGAAGREAVLTSRIAGASAVVGRAPLPDGPVDAGGVRDETSYTFAVGGGGAAARGARHAPDTHAVRRGDRQTRQEPLHRRDDRPLRDGPRPPRDRARRLRLVRVRPSVPMRHRGLRCSPSRC